MERLSGLWPRTAIQTDHGSGKSTTLYAAINETNDPRANLITVEDPVEYRLAGLSQVHVNEKAGLTSQRRCARSRQTLTVMIGEIRIGRRARSHRGRVTGHPYRRPHINDAPRRSRD
jgi:type IV pilus assembly protein PilB